MQARHRLVSGGRRGAARFLFALALLFASASPAAAIFRFDEIGPRSFSYNDEYFINIFSYRPRISHRWRWAQASLGYDVTAGSLRNDELYLNQRALVRLPFTNNLSAEYRFVEWEDYDARFQRNEVELVYRFTRPAYRLPLLATVGNTPPPDGFFVGGIGLLDADKEFADLGFLTGYRGEVFGLRLDLLLPDFFFNGKNKEFAEYDGDPYTVRATATADLLGGDLQLSAWFHDDLPLTLDLPARQEGLVFRYRQVRAGAGMRWRVDEDLRFDVELWSERTRKRRRAPNDPDPQGSDRVDREAFRVWAEAELDRPALISGTSRGEDTWLFGVHVHYLDEETEFPDDRSLDETERRGESYASLGYVLSIPSPGPEYRFGVRGYAMAGYLSWRQVIPDEDRHRVTEKFLAKIGLGFEATFRDDLVFAFVQFTYRADDQSFGGGNAQVMMRF